MKREVFYSLAGISPQGRPDYDKIFTRTRQNLLCRGARSRDDWAPEDVFQVPMSLSSVPSNQASGVIKRSVVVDGHKTSISLEDAFWTALKSIAHAKDM